MTPLPAIAPNEIPLALRPAVSARLRADILEAPLTLRYRLMAAAIAQGVTRGKLARDHGRELLAELHRYAGTGAPIEHWHEDMVERRLMLPGRGQQRRRNAA